MTKQLLTLRDASARLNVSPSHLRLLCRRGIIPAEKTGRDWLITASLGEVERAFAAAPKRGKYARK